MTRVLRGLALLIVIAAAIDPVWAVRRSEKAQVDVRVGRQRAADPVVTSVRDGLLAAFPGPSAPSPDRAASAVVVIDPGLSDLEHLPAGLPISFVDVGPDPAVRLNVVRIAQPPPVLPGQSAVITAELQATGLAGGMAVVTLEQDGAGLARTERRIASHAERFTVDLTYAPPAAGVHRVRLVARSGDGAEGETDAWADAAVIVQARVLRVLVFEPRPSWALTFARRALEDDPAFDLAVLSRSSRGIAVRSGGAPGRLTAAALDRYDAVLAGAPEALSDAELQALESFVRVRGGSVVLQPDRRPSGAYLRLLPGGGFDEVLLEKPATLAGGSGELQASELALPRTLPPGATPLASVQEGADARPVIVAWPAGHGRFVFSGALDAWRYRASGAATFAPFWAALMANLAAAAPRTLEVSIDPAASAPGDAIRIRAVVRAMDPARRGAASEMPAVSAALIGPGGARSFVRLWPAAEPGAFEGTLEAPAPGRYVVEVTAGAATAGAPLLVSSDTRLARDVDDRLLDRIARATGGVVVHVAELDRLERRIGQQQIVAPADVRPMRSGWWLLVIAGALSAEWAVRRRRGLR